MIGKIIARLDSGLCRNDNGGVSYRLGKPVIPLENVILATPSFRRKPESSDLICIAARPRQAGMTTAAPSFDRNIAMQHASKDAKFGLFDRELTKGGSQGPGIDHQSLF